MVVASNTNKTSHLLKEGEGLGVIQDMTLVNLVLIRQWTHQM